MITAISSRWRGGLLALSACSALVAGCGKENTLEPGSSAATPSAERPSSQADLRVIASALDAPVGETVVVAIEYEATGGKPITALQGRLVYDAASLEYLGEVEVPGVILMVNAETSGELRLGAIQQRRLDRRAAQVAFRVKSAGYGAGLRFAPEELADLDGNAVGARVASAASADAGLKGGNVRRMTLKSWMDQLDGPGTYDRWMIGGPMAIAGGVSGSVTYNNKKYGDVTLDGLVSAGDASVTLNAGVGSASAASTLLSPQVNRDAYIAGNVAPRNERVVGGSTVYLEVNDPCPPGWATCAGTPVRGPVSSADASVILNGLGGDPVVGLVIPGRSDAGAGTVNVNGDITSDVTWTRNNVYILNTRVSVTNNATLTIEAGTRIEGSAGAGASALFIQRNGRIVAEGTELNPIQFTCSAAVKTKGCWGGIFIAGNAPVVEGQTIPDPGNCRGGSCPAAGTPGYRIRQGEGNAPVFGGTNPNDDSGILRYVRIEWAGFEVSSDNELNCLSMGGVGRGTTLEYVQCYKGLDDGFEWFGGTVNGRYLVGTGNSDDTFDYSFGYNGQVQFAIAEMDPTDGDKAFEGDNTETSGTYEAGDLATYDATLPLTRPTFVNFTVVGEPTPQADVPSGNSVNQAIHVRRGTASRMRAFIITQFPAVVLINDNATCTGRLPELENAVLFGNSTLVSGASSGTGCTGTGSVADAMTTGADIATTDPLFFRGVTTTDYLNGSDYRLRAGSPAIGRGISQAQIDALVADASGILSPSNFLQPTTYAGALPPVAGANRAWYAGWTNSVNILIRP